MKEYPFIDFHSHNLPSTEESDVITIYSHHQLEKDLNISSPHFFCAGAHPWFLPGDETTLLKKLLQLSQHDRFIFVGEIGLDRVKAANLESQIKFLEIQIQFAIMINSPAIVIHCVRAFDLFLGILKRTKFRGAIIFHDYKGNLQITEKLIQNAQVHFSLGTLLMTNENHGALSIIPIEKTFLETDDNNYSIKDVYNQYSKASSLQLNDTRRLLSNNFHNLFPDLLTQEQ